MALITLTTDFGLTDTYVGQMKGVILGICPDARIVDLTHGLPPQDVVAGALALDASIDCFGPETIHVGVVDPGVGTDRRAIAVRTDRGCLVGPDNGLFSLVLARSPEFEAVALSESRYHRPQVSPTFHGRDIFAPVAAHLAAGVAPALLGERAEELVRLVLPEPARCEEGIELAVLVVDHFGNCVTNLTRNTFEQWVNIERECVVRVTQAGGETVLFPLRETFGDVPVNQPVAYFGSSHRLELAVRNGNASHAFNITPHTSNLQLLLTAE